MASRGVLYLMGNNWFWQLLFADNWVAAGEFMMYDLLLAITCLAAWGSASWKKFRGGLEVTWIGYWANLTNLGGGSPQRLVQLAGQLAGESGAELMLSGAERGWWLGSARLWRGGRR